MRSATPTAAGLAVVSTQPLSLVDYPGRPATVLFVAGCNFRCPFCHNPELVIPVACGRPPRAWSELLASLRRSRWLIDSVVVTGGEPLLQPQLPRALRALRAQGLRVKLDTNGSRPDLLAPLLEEGLLDYVAMDVKAPLARYDELAGVRVDTAAIERSIRLLRRFAPDYEFRTTVAPTLAFAELLRIAWCVSGARRFVLQPFFCSGEGTLLDPRFERQAAMTPRELCRVWERIRHRFPDGGVRGVSCPRALNSGGTSG